MTNGAAELRFGIMCSGTEFADYAATAIERLLEMDRLELVVLIVDDSASHDQSGEHQSGAFDTLKDYSTTIYDRVREMGLREAVDDLAWPAYKKYRGVEACNRPRDLAAELRDVDRLHCEPIVDGYSEYFGDEDLERLREYDLDFVLRRGFGIIRGDVLDVPTYGVWSFHHGDERKYRGGPPGFWEIYDGEPITGAILQRLTDRLDGGIILRRGFFPTIPDHEANVNQAKYGSAEWPAQVARDILRGDDDYLTAEPSSTDAEIYTKPSLGVLCRYLLATETPNVGALGRGVSDWNIGVVDAPIAAVASGQFDAAVDWYPRDDAARAMLADPFGWTIEGQQYVFFEEVVREEDKGRIAVVPYDDGFGSEMRVALEEPFHVSYPYLFEYDDRLYAIPETNAIEELRLYRVRAADEWDYETTIATDVTASDPTIFEHDGRWWLFYTVGDGHASTTAELEIRHAGDPTGNWVPHENNPVKVDVRSARSGGTPFSHDGNLYRPAQYCAGEYGQRVRINEVTELTSTTFAEQSVREIVPQTDSPYPVGRHTLSAFGEQTLIDGKRRMWNEYTVRKRAAQVRDTLLGI